MTDYKKLVEALRHCNGPSYLTCRECQYNNDMLSCAYKMLRDAADAIEALQAELEQCTLFNTGLLNMREMSKEEADEIFEYIQNAPVWPIEPMQIEQLPKRGEWVRVEDEESYHYECSRCGERPLYSRYGDVVLSGVCPMCGAKMEVQDGQ